MACLTYKVRGRRSVTIHTHNTTPTRNSTTSAVFRAPLKRGRPLQPRAFGHLPARCPEPYPGGKRWLKLCHPPPCTLLLLHSPEHTHDSWNPGSPARWWPQESGQPHRQTREVRGRGSRRRRKEDSKFLRQESRVVESRGTFERHSRKRTALRPQQSSVSWRQPWPHRARRKRLMGVAIRAASAGSASSRPRPGRKPWATAPHLCVKNPCQAKSPQHSAAPWRWKAPRVVQGRDKPSLPSSRQTFHGSCCEGPVLPCSKQTPHVPLHVVTWSRMLNQSDTDEQL